MNRTLAHVVRNSFATMRQSFWQRGERIRPPAPDTSRDLLTSAPAPEAPTETATNPAVQARDPILARLYRIGTKRTVGYIGAFTQYDGVDDLLHAAAVLLDRGIDLHLILAGDGPDLARVQALIVDLELETHVALTGRVPTRDARRYYSLFDVIVFPRRRPPTPDSDLQFRLLEAMAAEKTILVARTGALTEIVAEGVSGLVFERRDINSLANQLARLLGNDALRAKLGKNARNWARIERNFGRVVGPLAPLPALEWVPEIPENRWRLLHDHTNRKRARAIVSYPWTGRVLEIGSGRGYILCLIARIHEPVRLVGIEPLPHFIEQTRALAARNEIAGISLVRCVGQHLPFPSESFDHVLVSEVLEHLHDPIRVLREVARVLAPGGFALLTVPTHGVMPPWRVTEHVQDFTKKGFQRLIADAGLHLANHKTVSVYEFYRVEHPSEPPA